MGNSSKRLGDFEIGPKLGEGGFGVVYRGQRLTDGLEVAVKTVRAATPAVLASLRREIAALADLDHPGIVQILDHGVDDGLPWYAMELLRGQPLSEILLFGADPTVTRISSSSCCIMETVAPAPGSDGGIT